MNGTQPVSTIPNNGQHANVHSAIGAVMAKVGHIQKTRVVGLSYAVATIESMLTQVRAAMVDVGLSLAPVACQVVESEAYKTAKQTDMRRVVLKVDYCLCHHPTMTSVTVASVGEAADSGDKATPKAMTAALKMAIKQVFLVETADAAGNRHVDQPRPQRPADAQPQAAAPKAEFYDQARQRIASATTIAQVEAIGKWAAEHAAQGRIPHEEAARLKAFADQRKMELNRVSAAPRASRS
ncbi:MAG: hypothetical protein ACYC35_16740 [Pirellulales bacterium]